MFVEQADGDNPFGSLINLPYTSVSLIDHDQDGDLDLAFGNVSGSVDYAENVGSADQARFEQRFDGDNPFDGLALAPFASPELFDYQNNGTIDLLLGSLYGEVFLLEAQVVGEVVTVAIALEPNGPSLTGVAPGLTVSENDVNSAPVLIDAGVTFGDPDGDLDGAVLTISGLLPEDRLSLASGAVISLSGGVVSYDADGGDAGAAVIIGAATGGNGTAFQITFNANADQAGVEAVIESLTYANVSNSPTESRDLIFSMTDAAGNSLSGADSWAVRGSSRVPVDAAGLTPELLDLDGDGDLDLVVGSLIDEGISYFKNVGSAEAPDFQLQADADNPFLLIGADPDLFPCFAFSDLDSDGDMDLAIVTDGGGLRYYANTGSASSPVFSEQAGDDNPFSVLESAMYGSPTFGDLDGDGDQDLIIGSFLGGALHYLENTGTAGAPVFEIREGADSPVDGLSVHVFPSLPVSFGQPTLADLDQDGDLDLVVGYYLGGFQYFENTGTSSAPVFVERTDEDNPIFSSAGTYLTSPTFGDLDGDGDLELLSGWYGEGLLGASLGSGLTVKITVTAEAEIVNGTASAELLMGGAEDDALSGLGGDDRLRGGGGDNTLDGGEGVDTADYSRASATVKASLATGAARIGAGTDTLISIERLIGSRFDDELTGDSGANRLDGGAGADRLTG